MYPVNLTGKRIRLRELTDADHKGIKRVYGDEEATRHLSFEPRTDEQVARIVRGALDTATEDPRQVYMLGIDDVHDGELIGAARLALGEYESGQVGFALRPDHWGHGKGIEAVGLLELLGFDNLGLHRIWGARSPLNDASARTMAAAGMIEEGRIRGHLFTRGAWRDSIVHSILSTEYAQSNGRADR